MWEGERERGEEERVGRWREGGRQRERGEVRVGCRGNRWGRNCMVRECCVSLPRGKEKKWFLYLL